jgi:hypothetical protein
LDIRLTTSPCKNKFVENLLRKNVLEEAKGDRDVVPLMIKMMMMMTTTTTTWNRNGVAFLTLERLAV